MSEVDMDDFLLVARMGGFIKTYEWDDPKRMKDIRNHIKMRWREGCTFDMEHGIWVIPREKQNEAA